MSQYYPQQPPGYPPPPPSQNPEGDYYYDDDDYEYEEIDDESGSFIRQPFVAFFGGGCLVFLCMSICIIFVAILWVADSTMSLSSPTPIPGSDIGLTLEAPAYPNESVVNDRGVQLTILEVNRNAVVETVPPVEGREVIIVTVELVNLGEQDAPFDERDFKLVNAISNAYEPVVGAIAGALGRGTLPPNQGLEGRLVFEVSAGDVDLRLFWQAGPEGGPRYIYLQ